MALTDRPPVVSASRHGLPTGSTRRSRRSAAGTGGRTRRRSHLLRRSHARSAVLPAHVPLRGAPGRRGRRADRADRPAHRLRPDHAARDRRRCRARGTPPGWRMDDGRSSGSKPDRQPRRHAGALDQRPLHVHAASRVVTALQRPVLGAVLRQPRSDDHGELPAGMRERRPPVPIPACHRQRIPGATHRRRRLHEHDDGRRVSRRHAGMSARSDHRLALLRGLYGDAADSIEAEAIARLRDEPRRRTADPSQADAWLIAYADSFRESGVAPLVTLRHVVERYLAPDVNGVHVLPFHPSSSDRGFSVVDYATVHPAFGTWDDIAALAAGRRFMADAVLNHMSAESSWFRSFLAGEPRYDRFFRTVDPAADLSSVVRPRTLPLVTTFD